MLNWRCFTRIWTNFSLTVFSKFFAMGRDRHTYTSITNGTQAGQTPRKGLQYNDPLMRRLPALSLVQLTQKYC